MRLAARHAPLVVLTACATYITAGGLDLVTASADTPRAWLVALVLALALHMAWILGAIERTAIGLIVVCWPISVTLCARGFHIAGLTAHPLSTALLLEIILLLSALALTPRASWAERLARWRRARAAIDVQLKMSDGLLPWIRRAAGAMVAGQAATPVSMTLRRMTAELADVEHALGRHVTQMALPETIRQTLETAAHAVVAEAQTGSARLAMEVERHALAAATECRDVCERLDDLSPDDRNRVATRCEVFLVDLAGRACGSVRASIADSAGEAA